MAALTLSLTAPPTAVAPGAESPAATTPTAAATGARTVWLRVPDVQGSYTSPYLQSSPDLEITTAFTNPAVVAAQLQLLRGDAASVAEIVITPEAPTACFTALAPAEYAVRITGLDAAGGVVSVDRYEHLAVGTVIAALGDSITEGYHSQGFWRDNLDLTPDVFPPDVVSRDQRNYPQYTPTTACHRPEVNAFASWMPRLNDLLAGAWQRPVFIANEGWGGFTTANYLNLMQDSAWQERMRLLKPTVWLIHLGVNDERAQVAPEAFAARLAAIVDVLLQDYAAPPARIYISRPCYDYAPGALPLLEAYAVEIDNLVAAQGLEHGPDFLTAYAVEKERLYGADPVHPNVAGMELMAELWAAVLTR
jgi:lysophospholipase L1-like esterase